VPAQDLLTRSRAHLKALCVEIESRRVGSEGNRAATAYAAEVLRSHGFSVETPAFDCIDWKTEGASIRVGSEAFEGFSSPYSLGCDVAAPLSCASTLGELESITAGDQLLLLCGELAREPLMPKNFPFYNPAEHREIIRLLEENGPAALIRIWWAWARPMPRFSTTIAAQGASMRSLMPTEPHCSPLWCCVLH